MQVKPRNVLYFALTLLIASGLLAGYTMYKLFESERMVRHTYQVQLKAAHIETNLARAGRDRRAYLDTSDEKYVRDFEDADSTLARELADIHVLTADNPDQQANCFELDHLVHSRLDLLRHSIRVGPNPDEQKKLSEAVGGSALDLSTVFGRMQQIESNLLAERRTITEGLFAGILVVIFGALVVAALLLRMYDRMLNAELSEREHAENNARMLSVSLMKVQDEERRRFSRELHDSLGQVLAAAKMTGDQLARAYPKDPRISELEAMLQDGLTQTRTLSHLLHPPLLDEIGLLSAARWFIESYGERTGIAVTFDSPETLPDVPKGLELALFRVMQESLTNVHKHSRGTKANVRLTASEGVLRLQIKDNGIGIPQKKFEAFQSDGTGVGIGLAGMNQRVKEQGGTFAVASDATGTLVTVEFLLGAKAGNGGQVEAWPPRSSGNTQRK